jgi:hypothetical protein
MKAMETPSEMKRTMDAASRDLTAACKTAVLAFKGLGDAIRSLPEEVKAALRKRSIDY